MKKIIVLGLVMVSSIVGYPQTQANKKNIVKTAKNTKAPNEKLDRIKGAAFTKDEFGPTFAIKHGGTVRFMITIDAKGKVIECDRTYCSNDELWRHAEGLVKRHTFARGDMPETGEITIKYPEPK